LIRAFLQATKSFSAFKGTINFNITITPSLLADSDKHSFPVSDKCPKFPYLTQKCFHEKRVDTVETEIRAACKGTAEALWRTLWNNENLGFLEVEYTDATTLYRGIEKWYGKLPYSERNFRKARNKRYVP
jgi:hypothetical protein